MSDEPTPETPAQEVLPAITPVPIDSITEAVHNELKPEEMARMTRTLFELTEHSESDPSRVSAAKLLFDRLMSKEDPEQKRRDAEERNAAIADARCILAEFAAHKLAGLHASPEMAAEGETAADNA